MSDNVSNWSMENKLFLNMCKCKMAFDSVENAEHLSICLTMSCKRNMTFLGITFDRKSSIGGHIRNLTTQDEQNNPTTAPIRLFLAGTKPIFFSEHLITALSSRILRQYLVPLFDSHKYRQGRKVTNRGSPCANPSCTHHRCRNRPRRSKPAYEGFFPYQCG